MGIVISGNKNLKFIKAVYYQPVMPPPNPYEKYLTIEPLEDDFQIEFYNECNALYSLNGSDWTPFDDNMSPVMNVGDKLYVKGELEQGYSCGYFYTEQSFNLLGNCNSLIFGDNAHLHDDLTGYNDCYNGLFASCEGLRNVSPNFLPATTLDENCYASMFDCCESLVSAPKLPATTLAYECYSSMFASCISLVTAPALPATELAEWCYNGMFTYCISLVSAPALPATVLAEGCYSYMFASCISLVTAPALPATELAYGCYNGMFSATNVLPDCTNIYFTSESVVASGGLEGLFDGTNVTDEDLYNILPINPSTGKYCLPVTKLAEYCYSRMFSDCESLVTAPELPATTLIDGCYSNMFGGCSSLVSAPALPATTLTYSCYANMFNGCSSLISAPELPATTLAERCYQSMFYNCTKLNYIKALFTTTPGSNYTTNWVKGVSSTGAFVKSKDATWNIIGVNGIPSGWTVQTA